MRDDIHELIDDLYEDPDLDDLVEEDITAPLINVSDEQRAIIEAASNGQSIMVNAAAGSGKTTTVLALARRDRSKKILMVTYNRSLRLEVTAKASGDPNLTISNYHQLCVKYYDSNGWRDEVMNLSIISNAKLIKPIPLYDIVVIDEAQDMNDTYYRFMRKFMKDMGGEPVLLIMGDTLQSVYEFKKADRRYLSLSSEIWDRDIIPLPLKTTYRCTSNIASFVNECMLGYEKIVSEKEGPKIQYYKMNGYDMPARVVSKLKELFIRGYEYEDVFILAPSIKDNGGNDKPIKRLERACVGAGFRCSYSDNDDESRSDNVIRGKIAFGTLCGSKGRERKIVIIVGFDMSYFTYYNKNGDQNTCPNALYVGVTRSSEHLFIIDDARNDRLPFLKHTYEEMWKLPYIDFNGPTRSSAVQRRELEVKIPKISVSMLLRYPPYIEYESLFEEVKKPRRRVNIDSEICTNKEKRHHESVSDITALAISSIYMKQKNGKSLLSPHIRRMEWDASEFYKRHIQRLRESKEDEIYRYLYGSNILIALDSKLDSRLNQINRYEWMTQPQIDGCLYNMEQHITAQNLDFEISLIQGDKEMHIEYRGVKDIDITGRVDIVDSENVWEIKCTNTLSSEHFLQVIFYNWMWKRSMKKNETKSFHLLNIRTGECYRLVDDDERVNDIVDKVIIHKYIEKGTQDDDDAFIKRCKGYQIL